LSVRYLDRSGRWARYDGRKSLRPVVFARDPSTGREKAVHYGRERRGTPYSAPAVRRVTREYAATVEKKREPEVVIRGRGPYNYVAVQYQVSRHDAPAKLARKGFKPREKVWVSARIEEPRRDVAIEKGRSLAEYYLDLMERKGYNRSLAPLRVVIRRVKPGRFKAAGPPPRRKGPPTWTRKVYAYQKRGGR